MQFAIHYRWDLTELIDLIKRDESAGTSQCRGRRREEEREKEERDEEEREEEEREEGGRENEEREEEEKEEAEREDEEREKQEREEGRREKQERENEEREDEEREEEGRGLENITKDPPLLSEEGIKQESVCIIFDSDEEYEVIDSIGTEPSPIKATLETSAQCKTPPPATRVLPICAADTQTPLIITRSKSTQTSSSNQTPPPFCPQCQSNISPTPPNDKRHGGRVSPLLAPPTKKVHLAQSMNNAPAMTSAGSDNSPACSTASDSLLCSAPFTTIDTPLYSTPYSTTPLPLFPLSPPCVTTPISPPPYSQSPPMISSQLKVSSTVQSSQTLPTNPAHSTPSSDPAHSTPPGDHRSSLPKAPTPPIISLITCTNNVNERDCLSLQCHAPTVVSPSSHVDVFRSPSSSVFATPAPSNNQVSLNSSSEDVSTTVSPAHTVDSAHIVNSAHTVDFVNTVDSARNHILLSDDHSDHWSTNASSLGYSPLGTPTPSPKSRATPLDNDSVSIYGQRDTPTTLNIQDCNSTQPQDGDTSYDDIIYLKEDCCSPYPHDTAQEIEFPSTNAFTFDLTEGMNSTQNIKVVQATPTLPDNIFDDSSPLTTVSNKNLVTPVLNRNSEDIVNADVSVALEVSVFSDELDLYHHRDQVDKERFPMYTPPCTGRPPATSSTLLSDDNITPMPPYRTMATPCLKVFAIRVLKLTSPHLLLFLMF